MAPHFGNRLYQFWGPEGWQPENESHKLHSSRGSCQRIKAHTCLWPIFAVMFGDQDELMEISSSTRVEVFSPGGKEKQKRSTTSCVRTTSNQKNGLPGCDLCHEKAGCNFKGPQPRQQLRVSQCPRHQMNTIKNRKRLAPLVFLNTEMSGLKQMSGFKSFPEH